MDVDEKKFNGNDGGNEDLLAVLLQFEKYIKREIRVASIAKVKSINGTTAVVQTYPQLEDESDKNVECQLAYQFQQADALQIGDIVVVLYMDRNFQAALAKLKANQVPSKLNENIKLHYDRYGIIIAKL